MKAYHFVLSLLFVAFVACEKMPFNKGIEKQDLYGEWYLEKTRKDGETEYPSEAEKDNKLVLNSDMTFVCIEKGERIEGEWEYHRMTASISLMEDDNSECIYYKIEDVDSERLVYSYKENLFLPQSKVKVYMTISPDQNNQNTTTDRPRNL